MTNIYIDDEDLPDNGDETKLTYVDEKDTNHFDHNRNKEVNTPREVFTITLFTLLLSCHDYQLQRENRSLLETF